MNTNLDSRIIDVELSTGATIPLRPICAKSGNVYHAVLATKADGSRYASKYGVKVAASVVGGDLPEKAMVEGVAILGESGTTQKSGNPKVSFAHRVEIDGQVRNLSLIISRTPDGNFNVIGRLARPTGKKAAVSTAL